MRNECILAVDVGGSSLRTALVRADGTIMASAAVPLPVHEPRPGWAELNPETWWRAFLRSARRVLRDAPLPAAICVGALTRTQVFLDDHGRTLGRAILFRDRRAAAIARELPGTTAFDAHARLAFIARHQPARHARIAVVVEPKDYLNFRLTGVIATDSVTRSRDAQSVAIGAAAAPADTEAASRSATAPRTAAAPAPHTPTAPDTAAPSGNDHAIAPPPPFPTHTFAPWQQVGVVQPESIASLAGVPVFAGSLDTWACAIGAGAVSPGQAYDVAGTSEAVGLLTAQRASTPGLMHLDWAQDTHHLGGPTQAGADCARWCHDTFRLRGTLPQAIARVGSGLRAHAPLFLPYLAGERAPVWSSAVRGAFHLIDRAHGSDDFLWSTLEGVAHAVRDILQRAQDASGIRMHELRVCGGGAQSDAWCALKADVLGVPVLRSRAAETGVVGAAMAAAVGLGAFADLADAAQRMARPGRRFLPRARHAATYAQRAALYDHIRRAALDLVHAP